jgi:flagellar biosynthetic protein FliR
MPGELIFPISTLVSFLLVLTRLSGIFVFVPLPGTQSGSPAARILLCVALTISLFEVWPAIDPANFTIATLVGLLVREAALGVTIGLCVALVSESLVFAAQVLSLQAGYAYASIIDPTTQADSGVLLIVAQLTASLLFFAFGLESEVLRALAASLQVYPPGAFSATPAIAQELLKLAGSILVIGLRLAMPVAGLMILVDLSLAVLGRLHAQIQLTQLSFPVKLLLALGMLATTLTIAPRLFERSAAEALAFLRQLLHVA